MKFSLIILVVIILNGDSFPINDNITKDPMEGNFFEGDIAGVEKGIAQILPTANYEKWPDGKVSYLIDPFTYDENQTATILSGMRLIEDQTRVNGKDCIKFVPRSNETTYIRIYNGQGCWSYVGKQKKAGEQLLSLQKPTAINKGSCVWKGIVAHELIHALGFYHEQSRPDRDDYVDIKWENIKDGTQSNFNKYTIGVDTLGERYDYLSIMHYQWNAFSKNGQATIVAKQPGIELVNASKKDRITDIDATELKKFYGCIW